MPCLLYQPCNAACGQARCLQSTLLLDWQLDQADRPPGNLAPARGCAQPPPPRPKLPPRSAARDQVLLLLTSLLLFWLTLQPKKALSCRALMYQSAQLPLWPQLPSCNAARDHVLLLQRALFWLKPEKALSDRARV